VLAPGANGGQIIGMPSMLRWTLLGVAVPALTFAQAPQPAATPAAAPNPAQPGAATSAAPATPAPATPPAAAASPNPGVSALLAEADSLWPVRDGPGKMDEMKGKLDEAEKRAPKDYGVLWRMSRWYYWAADELTLSSDEKSRLGHVGWEYGDKATGADPQGVEGWFYATAGVGNYSLAMGVVTALLKGMEGKFVDRLKRAEQLDANFDSGAIDTTWGRYYYELPWPKYDAEKCERWLRKALRKNQKNVRAKVYLAELFIKEDYLTHARKQLEEALAVVPGAYDAPEERRYQVRARELLAGMKK
jgi:tetratricopeptide (TPR) repeat protein